MPLVGTSYKKKITGQTWGCIEVYLARSPNGPRFASMKRDKITESFDLRQEDFWAQFEEIPSEKQEEKCCALSEIATSCNGPCGKNEVRVQLSDEVLEAMEKLRFHVDCAEESDYLKYSFVRISAQALLSALDRQKDCSSEVSKEEEKKPCQSCGSYEPHAACGYIGLRTPQEKPASIWKSVKLKKMDKWQNLFVKYGDGEIELLEKFEQLQMRNRKNTDTIEEFCTLTDFIQDTERTKSELAGLKAKVDKLIEGK